MTIATISAACFIAGVVLFLSKNWPKAQVILFFIAGLGVGGTIGRAIGRLVNSLSHGSQTMTAQVTGVAVPFALALVMCLYLWHYALKKGATTHRLTPIVALMLSTVLAVTGGTWAQANDRARDFVTSASDEVSQTFSDIVSGW